MRNFFTYFTNIDYCAHVVDLNPTRLLATFASRSIFSNNFFSLRPDFYLSRTFLVLKKSQMKQLIFKGFQKSRQSLLGMVCCGAEVCFGQELHLYYATPLYSRKPWKLKARSLPVDRERVSPVLFCLYYSPRITISKRHPVQSI